MVDCTEVTEHVNDEQLDPRLTDESIRCLPGTSQRGTVLLVGVVHDHPASIFRVSHLLTTLSPTTLAVELPPLALPLFESYARDVFTPPRLGGEMSMALQAAGDIPAVGIDAPNAVYLRLMARRVAQLDRANEISAVLTDVMLSFKQAVACRLGGLIGAYTPIKPRVYSHIEYACTLLDSPAVQAEHEAAHLSQQRAFLRAIEVPRPRQLVDEIREESMIAHLRDLRQDGDVIAVIGMEHLDALTSGLAPSVERR